MPRKKSEFKPLTYKSIVKANPQRRSLKGDKDTFKRLIKKGTYIAPFDKKPAK